MFYDHIEAEDLGWGVRIPLAILPNAQAVYEALAREMLETILRGNAQGRPSVLIVPVGPTGQYAPFVHMVNEGRISLRDVWFINMDEYLNAEDVYIDEGSHLSFRGFMQQNVYSQIDPALVMPTKQRVFPDPRAPEVTDEIVRNPGVDLCIGGIGINGHLAFNEPQPELSAEEFANLDTRVLDIAPETRAINCVDPLGGSLKAMPGRCVTIGMRQILAARRVRLGAFRNWHRAVVRRAAYGEIGADFPVTLLQKHPDAQILMDTSVAQRPW